MFLPKSFLSTRPNRLKNNSQEGKNMEEKFKVKRVPKEAPIEFAQLRTYPEAAKMVEEVMQITNNT